MIIRQLVYTAGADQVRPAVADVGDAQFPTREQHCHDGGPHPLELGGTLGDFINGLIGKTDGAAQPVGRLGKRGILAADDLLLPLEIIPDDAHRQAAGLLPRGVAAHAVGNDQKPHLLIQIKVVFVVGSDQPLIGFSADRKIQGRLLILNRQANHPPVLSPSGSGPPHPWPEAFPQSPPWHPEWRETAPEWPAAQWW